MKPKLSIVGALLILSLGWYFIGGDSYDWPIVNDHPNGTVIVAFGDSLTYGQGAGRGKTYPDHLAKLINRDIINEGHNGDTTGDGLRRLSEVLSHRPAIVVITLGGNDMMRRTPREETLNNLREIFRTLQAQRVMVVYGAVDPPLIGGGWSDAVRELCRKEGVLYVPNIMRGLWSDAEKMSDQIHPNGEGYRVLAERIHARLAGHFP